MHAAITRMPLLQGPLAFPLRPMPAAAHKLVLVNPLNRICALELEDRLGPFLKLLDRTTGPIGRFA